MKTSLLVLGLVVVVSATRVSAQSETGPAVAALAAQNEQTTESEGPESKGSRPLTGVAARNATRGLLSEMVGKMEASGYKREASLARSLSSAALKSMFDRQSEFATAKGQTKKGVIQSLGRTLSATVSASGEIEIETGLNLPPGVLLIGKEGLQPKATLEVTRLGNRRSQRYQLKVLVKDGRFAVMEMNRWGLSVTATEPASIGFTRKPNTTTVRTWHAKRPRIRVSGSQGRVRSGKRGLTAKPVRRSQRRAPVGRSVH